MQCPVLRCRMGLVSAHTGCGARDTVEQLEGVRFNRVEAPTVQDCLMQIYLDEVTATMYDESVLLFRINQVLPSYPTSPRYKMPGTDTGIAQY
eukprot:1436725-Rhodomonas_salina.5